MKDAAKACGTPGCHQPDFHIGPCDSTDAGGPRKRRQAEPYKPGSATELTRELRESKNQKKPAKPAAPSPNPKRSDSKRPDPFAFPDADPFDFTGEGEGSCEADGPVQKLVRQKTSSSAGQPSPSATGAAEVKLELHLSEKSKTGYLYVNHAGSRFRAEVRTTSLGNYDTAVEAAAAVARHLHLHPEARHLKATTTAAAAAAVAAVEEEAEEEEEEELEYVIECVLEQRKQGRTTAYLVKWKGYDQAKETTWEPAASLKDTSALEEYLAPRLDIMGNRWSLGDASVSVRPAGSDEAVTLTTPAPPTALACDFGGYVWLLAGAKLYRLDPRGPAAWSNPAVSTAAELATPTARGALALTHGGPLGSRAALRPLGPRSAALNPHRRRRPECWFGHSGPGYTDDGMARRECPGEAPTGCVGAYHGDRRSHEAWVEVALPEAPLALQPPRASDHVVVTMPKAGPREVRQCVMQCIVVRCVVWSGA